MSPTLHRRQFLKAAAVTVSSAALTGLHELLAAADTKKPWFEISLAQWSLHRAIRDEKKIDPLDFAKVAKEQFGIAAVEYVNQFYMDKAKDQKYLGELKKRADDHGVRNLLIMCDREGSLGDNDAGRRKQAVENHYKWVEAAKFLGCHSIRVNAATPGPGSDEEKMVRAVEGLRDLTEFAAKHDINVIVENHGGLSSNGAWLAGVMKKVDHPRCGTLPDFGNFRIDKSTEYDRYKGVAELMPFAKGVSAKSYDFDDKGDETSIDYRKMLKIVKEAGYRGFIGIEYEGRRLSEPDGIRATKKLLERLRQEV